MSDKRRDKMKDMAKGDENEANPISYKPKGFLLPHSSTPSFQKHQDPITGKIVTIKKVFLDNKSEGVPSFVVREVSLLMELNHPNVIRLLDVSSDEQSIDLVYEYVDCDLLLYMSKKVTKLKSRRVKRFLYHMLDGLAYCHSMNVVHQDLHPRNLMINEDEEMLKISNFSRALGTHPVQSILNFTSLSLPQVLLLEKLDSKEYLAPEVLLPNGKYSFPADVWSVGCVFAEMVTYKPLFDSGAFTLHDQLNVIFRIMGTPTEETLPGWDAYQSEAGHGVSQHLPHDLSKMVRGLDALGLDLLKRMLCIDPRKRIKAADALQHEYFKDIEALYE